MLWPHGDDHGNVRAVQSQQTHAVTVHWSEWTRAWTTLARWETPSCPAVFCYPINPSLESAHPSEPNYSHRPKLLTLWTYGISSMAHWEVLRADLLLLETFPRSLNYFHSPNLSPKPHEIWAYKSLTLISQAPNMRPKTYVVIPECVL